MPSYPAHVDPHQSVIERGSRRYAPNEAHGSSRKFDEEGGLGYGKDYSYVQQCSNVERSSHGTVRVRIHRCRGAFEDRYHSQGNKGCGNGSQRNDEGYQTYVVVYNDMDRGKSETVSESFDPVFNEEFYLRCKNPSKDALVITVVRRVVGDRRRQHSCAHREAQTKDQKVGECILSLENLEWQKERMVWVPLVRKAGSLEAYEQGEILVSMYSEDFGLDAPVLSEDDLSMLSRDVHHVLLRYAREELHRYDWLTGHYSVSSHKWENKKTKYIQRSARDVSLAGRGMISCDETNRRQKGDEHSRSTRTKSNVRGGTPERGLGEHVQRAGGVRLNILVKEVDGLTDDAGRPSGVESCRVSIASDSGLDESFTTIEVYRKRAVFQQDFFVTLSNADERIRFSVTSAGKKLGETTLGLFNMYPKKPTAVVLLLVAPTNYFIVPPSTANRVQRERRSSGINSSDDDSQICVTGYLHLTVYTQTYSSIVHYNPKEAELLYGRVLAYLWYCCRREFYQLHPILGRLQGVEQGMRELSSLSGPEPVPARIRLYLRDCHGLCGSLAQPNISCFVELHVGPFRQRCKTVITSGNGLLRINEPLEFLVHEGYTEPCTLMLIVSDRNRNGEVGRVTFGCGRMQQGQKMKRSLRLTSNAFSSSAMQRGEQIYFDLEAIDRFGWDPQTFHAAQNNADEAYYLNRIEGSLSRQQPSKLHTAPYMLDCTAPGREMELMTQLDKTFGNSVDSAPMTVEVLGIKNFQHSCKVRVKVEMNGEIILQVTAKEKGSQIAFDLKDNNDCVVTLYNAVHTTLRISIVSPSTFGSDKVLGFLEVSLKNLVRGERNILWLPFYNEDVVAGKLPQTDTKLNQIPENVLPSGFFGLSLQSMAFPRVNVIQYPQREHCVLSPEEEVVRDVSTLLLKNKPSELPRIQPLISDYPSLDVVHRHLRKALCANSVAATLYITVDEINIDGEEGREEERNGHVAVRFTCGREVQTTRQCTEKLKGMPPRMFYPITRLDVPLLSSAVLCEPHPQSNHRRHPLLGKAPGSSPRVSAEDKEGDRRTKNLGVSHYGQGTRVTGGESDPPVPPLVIELVALKGRKEYDNDSYNEKDQQSDEESALHNLEGVQGDAIEDMNRLRTYQLGGKDHYGKPLPAAPFRRGVLGEAHLSIRALLTKELYTMGEAITIPIIAVSSHSNGRRIAIGQVGTIRFRILSSAFEADSYPSMLRLDCTNSSHPPLDGETIHYYEKRILSRLNQLGASSLAVYHYLLYEHHVASGEWPTSLREWLESLRVPRYS